MLRDLTAETHVYLVTGYTDLRRSIDGLAEIVQGQLHLDPFSTALFLFCGRRRDRIKGLLWEGDGFLLLYKRLDSGENPENDANYVDDIEPCHIRRAEYPKPMIPGSFCSPELLAHIVYEKYAKAVPLHRQEKDFNSKRVPLLKATMSNWVGNAAQDWCLPIVEKMREILPEYRHF